MKKFLFILCFGLICVFALTGCSAKENITKLLDTQNSFASEQEANLDLTKKIFSDGLEEDYNLNKNQNQKLDIRTLERLIQTSNLTISKLKVYLENDDVVEKLKDNEVKNLIKLQNTYYDNFKNLISFNKSLEDVIAHGSKNMQTDYAELNGKIKSVLISSSECSKKLTDMLKSIYNINIAQTQDSLGVGELEILMLECSSNLVYYYSKIYIEETNLESFGNLTPNMSLDDVLEKLTKLNGSKFNLTKEQFAEIKNEILILQNLNNVIISKSGYFSSVIKNFSYDNLKESAKTAYPNETSIETSVLYYISSDKIDPTTQSSYSFIADIISNNFAPSINNILSICSFIESI